MSEKKILAWHFLPDDRMLANQTPPMLVEPGFIYGEPEGEIVICERGMHGSRRVYDALKWAAGSQLCRVRMWGDVTEHADKLVSRYREVLAIRDVASELRLWGCWCIRNTPIADGRFVWDLLTDERSRHAVEVAEKFARGEATREELDSAASAAWTTAREARDAARAASWASWAAGAIVRDAARAGDWAGDWAARAARAADLAAAGDAAVEMQANEIERRMMALFGEDVHE